MSTLASIIERAEAIRAQYNEATAVVAGMVRTGTYMTHSDVYDRYLTRREELITEYGNLYDECKRYDPGLLYWLDGLSPERLNMPPARENVRYARTTGNYR